MSSPGLEDDPQFVTVIADEKETMNIKANRTTYLSNILYYHEYFSLEMWRGALTELVATATIIFALTGSVISCLESNGSDGPNLTVAFTVFVVGFLFLLVTIPLSGGHMNPTFTYIALLRGIITCSRASAYILAQCIGSTIGFLLLKAVMSHQAVKKYSLGGCLIRDRTVPSSDLSPTSALVMEFSCTFAVLYVGVTVALDKRRSKELGLPMVCAIIAAIWALTVFVSITITGQIGYGGVGLNPARCLGAALVEGGQLWYGHWVFWVGPFLACTIYHVLSLTFPSM